MSSSGEPGDAEGPTDAADRGFDLTSPSFQTVLLDGGGGDGGPTIPAVDTCADPDASTGMSPELDWTPGPAGTMSYALVLTDHNNNLNHWAVWDIPASTTSLPAGLPKGSPLSSLEGAFQNNFQGNPSYVGPCPSGALHVYEFELFAIGTATLPGEQAGASTSQVYAEANKVALATAALVGRSAAKQ